MHLKAIKNPDKFHDVEKTRNPAKVMTKIFFLKERRTWQIIDILYDIATLRRKSIESISWGKRELFLRVRGRHGDAHHVRYMFFIGLDCIELYCIHCGVLVTPRSKSEIGINDCIYHKN